MKESTKPRIGRMLGDSPSRKMDKVELISCEKLASGRPGRRNRLPHLPCCPKVCKLGGAGGFACRANFSHLLSEGTGCRRNRPLADAWGYLLPLTNTSRLKKLTYVRSLIGIF